MSVRRWGGGILRFLGAGEGHQRWVERAQDAHPLILRTAVMLAAVPGIPTAVVSVIAGTTGMRLSTSLLFDIAGAVGATALVAGLGFTLGDPAVEVVLVIDRYASAVSVAVVASAIIVPLTTRLWRRTRRRGG